MNNKKYVLITPAKNEEISIEKTIKSVISQTVLPMKWVIVSDGSTDRTDEIISKYLNKYKFIQLVKISSSRNRDFGSKVKAFNAGYETIKNFNYDFIGNLDADVSFESNYFESILNRFEQNPKLGIAGGIISELQSMQFNKLSYDLNSVAGAVQLFRRRCYDDIGGYIYSEIGGIDAVAEGMARMNGWEVRTFPEIDVCHYRRIGRGNKGNFISNYFRYGIHENLIGNHPLFTILKGLIRSRERPYILGGIMMIVGYYWSWIRGDTRPVSDEYINFIRSEQKQRMLSAFSKKSHIKFD